MPIGKRKGARCISTLLLSEGICCLVRQIRICYSLINPYLPIKYRYTRLIATPAKPYSASIISVVFKIGKNISYIKFVSTNKIPTIMFDTYFLLVNSSTYPINVHNNKLKVKLVMRVYCFAYNINIFVEYVYPSNYH